MPAVPKSAPPSGQFPCPSGTTDTLWNTCPEVGLERDTSFVSPAAGEVNSSPLRPRPERDAKHPGAGYRYRANSPGSAVLSLAPSAGRGRHQCRLSRCATSCANLTCVKPVQVGEVVLEKLPARARRAIF